MISRTPGSSSTQGAPRLNAGRKLPDLPIRARHAPQGTSTAADTTGPDGAPELQTESSNLSYQPDDGSHHGDDASSSLSLSFLTEECSVERAELLTVTDPTPADHSRSPRGKEADVALLDFLSDLRPEDLDASEASASPDKRLTRKSEVRSRFASQHPSAARTLNVKLNLPVSHSLAAEGSTTTSSQESPTKPPFVQASPRPAPRTPVTPRPERRQRTSHRRPQDSTAHSRSGSLDSIPEGVGSPSLRPSTRRRLDKTTTRREMTRVTTKPSPTTTIIPAPQRQMNAGDDFDEIWTDLGQLADQILALPAPGSSPLTASAEENLPVSEKPPADN